MANRFELERTKAKMDSRRGKRVQQAAEARERATKVEFLRRRRERRALAALVAIALSDGRLAAELDKLGYDLVKRK
jgi:hypothetical protein